MTPDRRPCQRCGKPILGQSHHDGSVWLNELKTGVRRKAPEMGYDCVLCVSGQDSKMKAAGE